MKKNHLIILTLIMISFSLTACSNNSTPQKEEKASPAVQDETASAKPQSYSGTVIDTMSTAGYTYVQVDTGQEKIWAAAPEFSIQKGAAVTVPPGSPMPNFESKTLNRTFDLVWFVPYVQTAKGEQLPPADTAKPPQTCAVPQAMPDLSGIKKAENGYTVAELFANQNSLAGKEVSVRGNVVKFNANIMKTNWIHIQDGTGDQGTNDLALTTDKTAKIGDTLLVKGTLVLNKDFGYGYQYDLIIENARITVE